MSDPVFSCGPDGTVTLRNLPPWLSDVLLGIPELLDEEQPEAVRDRLYPPPVDDAEARREWERMMVPELFALVASAREVVSKDLAMLARTAMLPNAGRVDIPREHRAAWISALNVARLTLAARHDLEEVDMSEEHLPRKWDTREEAIVQVHLLGWIQEHLILEDFSPPDNRADHGA